MSFDDYVRRMAQKYRLAISIAVINTRPENVSLEDYIQQLRNSINNDQIDIDDISISSVDFNMYETEFDNKTHESNDKRNQNNVENYGIYQNADESTKASTKEKNDDDHIDIDQNHRYQNNDEMIETNDEQLVTQNVQNSIVLQNLDMRNGEEYEITNHTDTSSSLKDIIDFIKDIDTNMTTIEMDVQMENLSQSTFCDSLRAPSVIMDTQCFYESDATFCNSLTCLDKFGMSQELNNSTAENNNMEQKYKTQLLSQTDKKEMSQKYDYNKKIQQNSNEKAQCYKHNSTNDGSHNILTSNKVALSKLVEKENKRDFQYETDLVLTKSSTNNIEEQQTINKSLYETSFVNSDNNNSTARNNVGSDKEKEKDFSKNNLEKYKLPIVSEISIDSQNNLTRNTDYFDSHYSESQKDIIIIGDKYIHGIKNIQELKKISNDVNKFHDEQEKSKLSTETINSKNIVIHIDKDVCKESHSTSRNEYQILEQDTNKEVNKPKNRVIHIDNDMFSQGTQFMTKAQNSKIGYNVISDKHIQSYQNAQQIDTYFENNDNHSSRNNFVLTNEKYPERNEIHNKCDDVRDINNHMFAKNSSQVANSHNINVNSNVKSQKHLNPFYSVQNYTNEKDKRVEDISTIERDTDCTNFEENLEDVQTIEDELTDSQIELIPFKVIEELNKVKVFLNRNDNRFSKDGYSSDSGYRSRSKSSLKMSQSGGGLNQAAHSLLSYILDCPLVKTNSDVTTEISVVLGRLVDKLHEEENYPPFLEELLDTVRLLLSLIYEESAYDHTFMKKEDDIQRLLLLNKSIHIQKYTIEKITNILENVYTELTAKDIIYEIENITRIENLSHIFHILETILKNKLSQNFSQTSSQNSQDDKLLKKSNITDVWRKKWNPNYKEVENVGSCEKKCVIQSCSAILNKLVVSCMEGYSLISYFALKCFNAIQAEK